MNDDVIVQEQEDQITIVDNQKTVVVDSNESPEVVIEDNICEVVVTEDVAEQIVINATDVRISPPDEVDLNFNCTAAEQVRDAVYISAANEVRQANNSDINTAKVVGFIVSKTTNTTCKVRILGVLDGFIGLEIGKQYFLSSINGEITKDPTITSGSVLVRLGRALDATNLLIEINNDYVIRNA